MQWEYKLVALGLIVDATEQNQREKQEQILNDLGREEWEAIAYAAQSDTVLLKRPAKYGAENQSASAGSHGRGDSGRLSSIHCFTQLIVASSACSLELKPFIPSSYKVIPTDPL